MGMRKNESNSLEPCPGYLATQIKEMPEIKVDEVPKIDIIELVNFHKFYNLPFN